MLGTGIQQDPYIIMTVDDLQDMADDLDAYYELGGDIDASATSTWNAGAGFVPVGTSTSEFTGQLDGKGYVIRELYINRGTDYCGLFGSTQRAVLKNIKLTDAVITGADYTGPLGGDVWNTSVNDCSSINGSITGGIDTGGLIGSYGVTAIGYIFTHCHSTGSVQGNDDGPIGGLVGSFNCPEGTVEDCYSTCTVSPVVASWLVGGLIGYLLGGLVAGVGLTTVFINCYATGSISESGDYTGGFAGDIEVVSGADITLRNCYATGNVTITPAVWTPTAMGGFVGLSNERDATSHITYDHCYATGTVSLDTDVANVGGFAGDVGGTFNYCYATGDVEVTEGRLVGGFAGNLAGEAAHCYATGNVIGGPDSDYGFGGFVGELSGDCSECFATGDVSGYTDVGGFVGWMTSTSSVKDCYSRGDLISFDDPPEIGGFVGRNQGSITNAYSTGKMTAYAYSVGPPATDLTYTGGFCGRNTGTISTCFWDKETSGMTASDGGIGKSTREMKTKKTFLDVAWDFITIWGRFSRCNDAYPCLRRVTAGCSRQYLGDVHVDQLVFQHAERMR